MLFDVKAALAEILNDEAAVAVPAVSAVPEGKTGPKPQEPRKPQPQQAETEKPEHTPAGAVVIHLERGPGLPTHPATCARCGKADWKVAMRTADGRTWHVACWKAERIEGASK